MRAESLAAEVAAAIEEHAIVQHPKHGRVYAYEVDGCTSFSLSRSCSLGPWPMALCPSPVVDRAHLRDECRCGCTPLSVMSVMSVMAVMTVMAAKSSVLAASWPC